jgi:hypothetical protein
MNNNNNNNNNNNAGRKRKGVDARLYPEINELDEEEKRNVRVKKNQLVLPDEIYELEPQLVLNPAKNRGFWPLLYKLTTPNGKRGVYSYKFDFRSYELFPTMAGAHINRVLLSQPAMPRGKITKAPHAVASHADYIK